MDSRPEFLEFMRLVGKTILVVTKSSECFLDEAFQQQTEKRSPWGYVLGGYG